MTISMDRWVGKVAIVTGASSGIGAALAERLVNEGLQVAGLARRKARLDELANKCVGQKGKFHPIEADVSKEEDILKAFKWIKDNLGPVHILVNNAGIAKVASLTDGSAAAWNDILQVNVIGLSIATREAVRNMEENAVNGHIIHINSIAGHSILNVDSVAMYGASKHSVTTLTEYLRKQLARKGSKIKVTSLSPGAVDTEIISEEFRQTDVIKDMFEKELVLDSEDIVEAAIYALSTPPRVQIHEIIIRPTGDLQ